MFVGINLGINLRSSVSFSPSALFAAGEPGVWFDPSDVANLSWLVNQLTQTNNFGPTSAFSTQTNVTTTDNSAVAPDGTLTAATMVNTTTNGQHRVYQSDPAWPTGIATLSVYAKADTASFVQLVFTTGGTGLFATFDLSSGVVSATGGPSVSSITPVGNGWYRCVLTSTTSGLAGSISLAVYEVNATAQLSAYAGTIKGILLWGAQLEVGPVATTYQPITTVNAGTIERFPNATLYTTPEGNVPVTTPGQTVGLMQDKSKQQSWFDVTGAVWTKTAGDGVVTVSGNTITITGATTATQVTRTAGSIPFTAGLARMMIQADWVTATGVNIWLRGGPAAPANGVQTLRTATLNNSTLERLDVATGSVTFTISYFQYWAGNNATQATPAARPIYAIEPAGGRRNLLTFSEDFRTTAQAGDTRPWLQTAVTPSASTDPAPNGTLTASKIVPTTATSQHVVNSASFAAGTYTQTVYAKADGYNHLIMGSNQLANMYAWFNLATGETGTKQSEIATTSMTPVGNGWYRCQLVSNYGGSVTYRTFAVSNADNVFSFAGDGTSGILLWGAQLEVGSVDTAYQKVTTQYDVTQAGKPSMSYLYFDGVNDAMATSTITPGIDKAQVFAGVRKLSSALSVLVELSADADVNNGTLHAYSETNLYAFRSRGTGTSQASYTNASVAAPFSSVFTGIGDISGDIAELRLNGTQVAISASNQGTGNFLAYPLYIGARNQASRFLNGHIYSLITRFGPNLPANTITSTERWVAGETGFYPPIITGVPTIGVS